MHLFIDTCALSVIMVNRKLSINRCTVHFCVCTRLLTHNPLPRSYFIYPSTVAILSLHVLRNFPMGNDNSDWIAQDQSLLTCYILTWLLFPAHPLLHLWEKLCFCHILPQLPWRRKVIPPVLLHITCNLSDR